MFDLREELKIAIDYASGNAELRLGKANPAFREKISRKSEIKSLLEDCIEKDNAEFSLEHKTLLNEYFNLEMDIDMDYSRAVYLQGIMECIKVLAQFGWLKQ